MSDRIYGTYERPDPRRSACLARFADRRRVMRTAPDQRWCASGFASQPRHRYRPTPVSGLGRHRSHVLVGATVKDVFWTLEEYDIVAIVEELGSS